MGIGVFFFFRDRNGGEKTYFLGGRQMGPWVSALSAGASDMSAWVLMGLPTSIYAAGIGQVWIAIGLLLGYTLSWIIIAPRLRRFSIVSDDAITIEQLGQIVIKAKMLPFTQEKEVAQGAFVRDGRIIVRYEDDETEIFLKELALGGRHNVYNSMAAALAAKATGISDEVIRKSLRTFSPIEHRLEPVLSIGDVLYINDSKATNVDSAWYALECQTRPVVWIVGGKDKGNDYSVLEELVRKKVKAIVCLGVDNAKIHAAFEGIVGSENIVDTRSAEAAVQASARFAAPGDVLLLSPCCASFDLFKNYEDRGRLFKEAVRHL